MMLKQFLRTVRVHDKAGKFLGQVHKRWFTGFSGVHVYEVRNAKDELLATAKVEVDAQFKEIILRSATSVQHGQVIGLFKVPRRFIPTIDSNNDYATWTIELNDQDGIFFHKGIIDPRLLALFVPYVGRWAYTNARW